jgi:methionine-gamma-lyase
MKIDTICAIEYERNITTKPHQLPIYATSSFDFESIHQGISIFEGNEQGHVYSRYGNPTIETVADKIAAMEAFGLDIETKGIMLSSGMAAISTLIYALLKNGDKIITQGNLYGGTTELFLKIIANAGIETIFMDLNDYDAVETALKNDKSIQLIYLETPSNPTLSCIDLDKIGKIAAKYNIKTAVDNTFCTPFIQQPFKFGIDYIIHSTTKYLNGHGNSIAGLIVGKDMKMMQEKVWTAMKLLGTNCSPFEAWLTNNGLKTLHLRMERHTFNAQKIAEFLLDHPKVEKVNYPGLANHKDYELCKRQMKLAGGMLSFELKGGLEAGKIMMDKIQLCSLAPTLGDVDTLILHPASMSHIKIPKAIREQNGITDGLIRLSVGIENIEDLIHDLNQAIG